MKRCKEVFLQAEHNMKPVLILPRELLHYNMPGAHEGYIQQYCMRDSYA